MAVQQTLIYEYKGYIIEPNRYAPVKGMEYEAYLKDNDIDDRSLFSSSVEELKEAIDERGGVANGLCMGSVGLKALTYQIINKLNK